MMDITQFTGSNHLLDDIDAVIEAVDDADITRFIFHCPNKKIQNHTRFFEKDVLYWNWESGQVEPPNTNSKKGKIPVEFHVSSCILSRILV